MHGDRFQRLWQRYKHNMSGNTWAGNAEMAAFKALYPVNIAVWQTSSGGIAHQVNRIVVGQAKTLHIRLANERHYQTTDIPFSYLPLQQPSIAMIPAASDIALPPVVSAVRLSGRERRPRRHFDA